MIYRVLKDEKAAIAVMGALVIAAMLVFAGLTMDLGLAFFEKRRLQAATDFAAMQAAQNPANAHAAALQSLAANGFSTASIYQLTLGNYQLNSTVPANKRFVAGGSPTNAVALTTTWNSPIYFARALVPRSDLTVSTSAAATETNEAGLVAGSGLLSINNGLLNGILGGLLGTNISLTLSSYQGLANTNISALDFLNALATQIHITSGTYTQLLSSTVSMQSIVNAEIAALSEEGQTGSAQVTALQSLQLLYAQVPGAASINVGQLFNIGSWQNAQIGSLDPNTALQANLNVFQLLSFSAQLANGSNFVALSNVLTVPGIATVDVALTYIEPAQGSFYTLGPVGLTVHTSQLRTQLTLHLLQALSVPPLVNAAVTLPVYLEVADGTATLTGVSCGLDPANDTVATVSAVSGVANAYIGTVQQNAMTNFSQAVTVTPAVLATVSVLSLPVAKVNGSAQASVQGNTHTLAFTAAQIKALTPQTVTSTNMVSNLLQTMASQTNLTVTLLGVLPVPTSTLTGAVNTLLQPTAAVLDTVVDQVLTTLGIRLGYLDVTVTGARCGIPALVQ